MEDIEKLFAADYPDALWEYYMFVIIIAFFLLLVGSCCYMTQIATGLVEESWNSLKYLYKIKTEARFLMFDLVTDYIAGNRTTVEPEGNGTP